jgi:RHS repeat-associated protein
MQGQYADSETGLYYNTFRYYDPDIGRLISEDPIGVLGGLNLYGFAANADSWVDPWGLHEVLAPGDLVCRGGECYADNFKTGTGVVERNGKLSGISTQAKPGASLETLATPFKNAQVGVATVGSIEAAGGTITLDGELNSSKGTHRANQATVNGITAEQGERLFRPTKTNPVLKTKRGNISGLCK